MKATIKGLERVLYTNKDGKEVDAVRIHVQHADAEVVGMACESIYIRTDQLENLGCTLPESKYKEILEKKLEIEYNSRGRIAAMSVLASSGYTQPQVDSAAASLRAAMNALQLQPPPIEPPIDEGRFLVDGVRLSDLLPAQEAIMDNFKFARSNGFKLFIILLAVWLAPFLLRRVFGGWSETKYIDVHDPTAQSRYFRSEENGKIHKKPYDDWPY